MAQTLAYTLAQMGASWLAETMAEAFSIALALHLGDTGGNPLEIEDALLLAASSSFGREVADTFALAAGLPGWEDFRRMFAAKEGAKPSKPSPEFIEAEARAIERDPARFPYAKALVADQLTRRYFDNLSDYENRRK